MLQRKPRDNRWTIYIFFYALIFLLLRCQVSPGPPHVPSLLHTLLYSSLFCALPFATALHLNTHISNHKLNSEQVREYCWGMPLDGLEPPYDYVVACDCVYVERLVEALVWSMTQVSGRGTTVLVASEKREEVTYAKFRARLSEDFTVRQAPRRHMDKAYDHENSEVLVCKMRRPAKGGGADAGPLGERAVAGSTGATVGGLGETAILEGKTGEKREEDAAGVRHDEAEENASADTAALSPDDASLPPSSVSDRALEGEARELSCTQDASHGTQSEVLVPGDEVDVDVGGLSLAGVSLVPSARGASGCDSRSKGDTDGPTGGASGR